MQQRECNSVTDARGAQSGTFCCVCCCAVSVVYECNSQCGCGPECSNRVLQRHPSFNPTLGLELFKTAATSWGVCSSMKVGGGLLIDEYRGVRKMLREVEELERDEDSTGYMFDCDTDALHEEDYPSKQFLSQVKKLGYKSIQHAIDKWPRVTVDAREMGSIARCQWQMQRKSKNEHSHSSELTRSFLLSLLQSSITLSAPAQAAS